CTGSENVAVGKPFSTTKPAGGVCARARPAESAHSNRQANSGTPQRPRVTMGSFPGDQCGGTCGGGHADTRTWVRIAGGGPSEGGRTRRGLSRRGGIIPRPLGSGQAESADPFTTTARAVARGRFGSPATASHRAG